MTLMSAFRVISGYFMCWDGKSKLMQSGGLSGFFGSGTLRQPFLESMIVVVSIFSRVLARSSLGGAVMHAVVDIAARQLTNNDFNDINPSIASF